MTEYQSMAAITSTFDGVGFKLEALIIRMKSSPQELLALSNEINDLRLVLRRALDHANKANLALQTPTITDTNIAESRKAKARKVGDQRAAESYAECPHELINASPPRISQLQKQGGGIVLHDSESPGYQLDSETIRRYTVPPPLTSSPLRI
ncbi:MAG: hypothetical protein M1835_007126 [Candelina submexicana]|nr:MAG: hypothetical protein M1835_007126 [Candelina submexicana]